MSFLTKAITLLKQAGYKITQPRRRVLEILAEENKAMNPYDIQTIDPTLDVVSVYRILDVLEQVGLVHKIWAIQKYILCDQIGSQHCHHYAICNCCACIKQAPVHHTHQHQLPQGFVANNQVFEIVGRCKNCT